MTNLEGAPSHPCTTLTTYQWVSRRSPHPKQMNGPSAHHVRFRDLVNAVRMKNITALNLVIISILAWFLAKLTTKYKELYMINSLITIIVTNLVLYGISESLAQALLSFDMSAPAISFTVYSPESSNPFTFERSPNPYLQRPYTDSVPEPNQNGNELSALSNPSGNPTISDPGSIHENPFQDDPISCELSESDSDVDEENLDRFIDYLRQSDTDLPYGRMQDSPAVTPNVRLSYFYFARLAGFMCWGFIMAFVQCWWYKFLQIYSKHPQFVEVLRKVMSDQFCFSPISLFCFFTYGTMVLESGTWNDTVDKLRKLYLQTLLINYCVWFPVQFINFLLIPRDFQVPFSSSISVLWNCFLSMRNSSANT